MVERLKKTPECTEMILFFRTKEDALLCHAAELDGDEAYIGVWQIFYKP